MVWRCLLEIRSGASRWRRRRQHNFPFIGSKGSACHTKRPNGREEREKKRREKHSVDPRPTRGTRCRCRDTADCRPKITAYVIRTQSFSLPLCLSASLRLCLSPPSQWLDCALWPPKVYENNPVECAREHVHADRPAATMRRSVSSLAIRKANI